jgi:hypothetical protein
LVKTNGLRAQITSGLSILAANQSTYGRFQFPISAEILQRAETAITRVIPAAARRALPANTAPLRRTAAQKPEPAAPDQG